MTVVEMQVDEAFVGLENAETRLNPEWAAAVARARNLALLFLLGITQLGWIGALAYFAYIFLTT